MQWILLKFAMFAVCTRKVIIKVAKKIFNSDKICRSYCDFFFGVTFFGTQCRVRLQLSAMLKVVSMFVINGKMCTKVVNSDSSDVADEGHSLLVHHHCNYVVICYTSQSQW